LKEEYIKWCNNLAYVNPAEFSATLLAFAHWSYEYSGHYLLLCDIQGVDVASGFVLTDPCLHCVDEKRFGDTNLGKAGMEGFFASHVCTEICEALGLPKHAAQPRGKKSKVGTKPVF
jgi:hypothetical protein